MLQQKWPAETEQVIQKDQVTVILQVNKVQLKLYQLSVYEVISTGHTPRAKTAQNAHRHVLVLSRLLAPKKCPHKTISGGMFQSSLIPMHKSLEQY